jgi:hypothetical protein
MLVVGDITALARIQSNVTPTGGALTDVHQESVEMAMPVSAVARFHLVREIGFDSAGLGESADPNAARQMRRDCLNVKA